MSTKYKATTTDEAYFITISRNCSKLLFYIHNNPVKDKIVTIPEDYYFSSARNYAGLDFELDAMVLDLF